MSGQHDNETPRLDDWNVSDDDLTEVLENLRTAEPADRENLLLALRWKADDFVFNEAQQTATLEILFALLKKTDNTDDALTDILGIIENFSYCSAVAIDFDELIPFLDGKIANIITVLCILAQSKDTRFLPDIRRFTNHKKKALRIHAMIAEAEILDKPLPDKIQQFQEKTTQHSCPTISKFNNSPTISGAFCWAFIIICLTIFVAVIAMILFRMIV